MKKEVNGGVVAGILAVVVAIAVVLGWRAIAPPAPAGIKSFDKATLKVMNQKHAESAEEIKKQQMQLLQQSNGGGR